MTIVSAIVIPLMVDKLGMSMDAAWAAISLVMGWVGMETIRPSGSVGLMGGKGHAPKK